MKHTLLTRCLSLILAMALSVQMVPAQAFAAKNDAADSSWEVPLQPTESPITAEPQEIAEKRTVYSKTFSMENGLQQHTVYSDAVHYESADLWQEIDDTLLQAHTAEEYAYGTADGQWTVQLPKEMNSEAGITLTRERYSLALYLERELRLPAESNRTMEPATAALQEARLTSTKANDSVAVEETQSSAAEKKATTASVGSVKLRYPAVFPNADVLYDLDSRQLKESIVLASPDAGLTGYRYLLKTGDLKPVLTENNEIELLGTDRNEPVMRLKAPYMLDAAGMINGDIKTELTGNDGIYQLTYYLPVDWLNDDARQWPVILDPTIEMAASPSNLQERTVSENAYYPTDIIVNGCGYHAQTGNVRFYMKYNQLPALNSGDVIVKATLQLQQLDAVEAISAVSIHEVMESWNENTISWNQQPQYNALAEDFAYCSQQGTVAWDITNLVQKWYNGENNGMVFAVTETALADSNGLFYFGSSDHTTESCKPVLTITYRNSTGLEDYWDYTSASAGRTGSGYVNQHSGNLVWVREDLAFGGNRMPVAISHIYNANDSTGNRFGLGYGWRTNYNQLIYQWSEDSSYFIWEDADGTAHYFKHLYDNVYLDEDGLELALLTGGTGAETYILYDKYGNSSSFDAQGRLSKITNNQQTKSSINITYTNTTGCLINTITDGVGRKYTFVYTNSLLSRLDYYGRNQTPLTQVNYAYSDSQLTQITDKDGEACAYTYGANHLLRSVTDVDGNKLTYTYSTETTGLLSRVISILETNGNTEGFRVDMEYGHNQTTLTDENGNVQILQFNNLGNTVSVQDDQGRALYYKYALDNREDAGSATAADATVRANQIRNVSQLQNTVGNILRDSSFESGTTWTALNSSVTRSNSTAAAYLGQRSLAMTRASSGTASGVCSSAVSVASGETYTFSAYVKTTGSAYLAIHDGSRTVTSEVLAAGNTWTRLEVSYTATASASITARLMTDSAGTTYMDCVQLERTPTASRYNLVENGDFLHTGTPAYGWTSGTDCTSADTRVTLADTAAPQLNAHALRINGDPTIRKYIWQHVMVSGQANDAFVLGGWAKGNSAPLAAPDGGENGRTFNLHAIFHYTDGTSEDFTVSFNPNTSNWQYASMPIVAKKAYSSVTVVLHYHYNINTVHFDGIQLFKEQFGTSYTYDTNGNVKTVTDIRGQITSYEYENFDLTREILPDGMQMSYTYDSYHNVETAETTSGQLYHFIYDAWGNNTVVYQVVDGIHLGSGATYTNDGNRLLTVVDSAGNVTTYNYDQNTNLLTWVQYPEDTAATRTHYTYADTYDRLVNTHTTTDTGATLQADYTYDGDLLKSVATRSTRYDFQYGPFGLPTSVRIGSRTLAQYRYTDHYSYLEALDYGNGDGVEYELNKQGNVTKETWEDGDTVVYEYDNNDALGSVTDSATGITTRYFYDLSQRLAKYRETGTGLDHSVTYSYDARNNLRAHTEVINGTIRKSIFTYDTDNRVTQVLNTNSASCRNYSYNAFGMPNKQETYHGNNLTLTDYYVYRTPTEATVTGQVDQLHNVAAAYNASHFYSYDGNGNIVSVSDGTHTTTYAYDSANQLLRENNQKAGKTWVWTYDDAGNILSKKEYAYTTAANPGTPTDTVTYGYGDSTWGDLLTSYDGRAITRDGIGNPLNDGTRTYTWEHGRQLASMTQSGSTWNFTYDASGMRRSRSNGTASYEYIYDGSRLSQMNIGSNTRYVFLYDATGPMTLRVYNGTAVTTYYYVRNLQGDIIAILNTAGKAVVEYTYDAWGNVLTVTGEAKDTIGQQNPLLYRGYVYDRETKLYYLQSRYYDPEMGRFLNADAYASTGQAIIGCNMFTYCNNAPVVHFDTTGLRMEYVGVERDGGTKARSLICQHQNNISQEKTHSVTSVPTTDNDITIAATVGNYFSLTLGAFNVAQSTELAFDLKGNIQLICNVGFDVTSAGSLSVSYGRSGSVFFVPDTSYLPGETLYLGGSVSVPLLVVPIDVTASANVGQTTDGYWGMLFSAGVATPSPGGSEFHGGYSNTISLTPQINLIDLLN